MTSREREIAQLLEEYEMPVPREGFVDALEERLAGVRPRRRVVRWLIASAAAAAVVVVMLAQPEESQPLEPVGALQRGLALARNKQYGPALQAFEEAREIDAAASFGNSAAALALLGRHEDALLACRQALELSPAQGWVWGNLGWILIELGRLEEALACLDRAVELDPNDPASHAGRAAALRALGRFQGAAAAEQRAQQLGGAPGLRFRFVPGR